MLHVRTSTQDNMFFGPEAVYATVVDDNGKAVKAFDPPFARLRARFYALFHRS